MVLTVPKSQDQIQGAEKQEESIECPGTTSSKTGELDKVSLENLITTQRFLGHLRSVLRKGVGQRKVPLTEPLTLIIQKRDIATIWGNPLAEEKSTKSSI